ncbi:endothelin-converting enzyme homolog [Periplaneta americana]|uniref:endothelin-converting enzyme homolog n=1 Tax=Periplaneta americana TaxID=6978 RepID=UPI0037E93245
MSEANISFVGSQQYLVPVSARKASLKKRTPLEVRLLILVAVLSVLLFIFFLIFVIQRDKEGYPMWIRTCNSEKCIVSAFNILETMDKTADPCEDFYRFACGNFDKRFPAEENMPYNDWFLEGSNALNLRLKGLLEQTSRSSDLNVIKQVKTLFKSCTDIQTLESLGLDPMMEVLQNLSLPRKIPDSSTAQDWDIATSLAAIQRRLQVKSLVSLTVNFDYNDTYLTISPPIQTLMVKMESIVRDHEQIPKLRRLTSEQKEAVLQSYMIRVLQLVDVWEKSENEPLLDRDTLQSIVLSIMQFQDNVTELLKEIANFTEDSISDYDQNSTFVEDGITTENQTLNSTVESSVLKINIEDLQSLLDSSLADTTYSHKIVWRQYITVLMDGLVNYTDIIQVENLEYFEKLTLLLANTELETIQRFMWWEAVQILAPHTNKVMREAQSGMRKQLYYTSDYVPRWKECLKNIKAIMPLPLTILMASHYNISDTVSKVSEMMDDIKTSFKSLVKESKWLDPDTKKAALNKADAIVVYIGYQDFILNPEILDEYYSKVVLVEDKYLWNIVKVKTLEMEELLSDNTEYDVNARNLSWMITDVLDVQASYFPQGNVITINAGILQFPFFGHGLEALNYGAIGSILGHELTHGFDNVGKEFGSLGERESWWNNETYRAYEERAQCFVRQYSTYNVSGNQVDGNLTLPENIADNGGMRETYRAYQRYKQRRGPESALAGMEEFTHEQLLFLAFANMWCLAEGKDYGPVAVQDEHSPEKFRVRGTLSNFPEFAKTWNCPASSSFNLHDRCLLW